MCENGSINCDIDTLEIEVEGNYTETITSAIQGVVDSHDNECFVQQLEQINQSIRSLGSNSVSEDLLETLEQEIVSSEEEIKQKMIEAFTSQNVMMLNISGPKLYKVIEPCMERVHYMRHRVLEWKDDENQVIRVFSESYKKHYVEKNKTFVNMSNESSFVTHVAMTLYH